MGTLTIQPDDFRVLLDLAMCCDPNPAGEENDKALKDLMDSLSREAGYNNWIEAFHWFQGYKA